MKSKKDIVFDVIFLASIAVCIVLVAVGCAPAKADVAEETYIEETVAVTTEATEPMVMEAPTEAVTEPTEPEVILYNVPLDEDLQKHIIAEANAHGIEPAIIMAMAYQESTYRTDAIGDNGNSYGLLQVQPRWHYGRMEKLGCTDLLDPYQNVTVGVDYLCELLSRYGSMDKALTAYNRGHYDGEVTWYARSVLSTAGKIEVAR